MLSDIWPTAIFLFLESKCKLDCHATWKTFLNNHQIQLFHYIYTHTHTHTLTHFNYIYIHTHTHTHTHTITFITFIYTHTHNYFHYIDNTGKRSLLRKSECWKATKKNIKNQCLFSSSLLWKSERRKEWKEHRKSQFCLIFTF